NNWDAMCQFMCFAVDTRDGLDGFYVAIVLVAELLESSVAPSGGDRGVVIESSHEKGRGTIAAELVQEAELKVGDMLLAGGNFGRVRALVDENGKSIQKAGPSIPVEVLGLDGVSDAGEQFLVVPDE